MGTGSCDPAVGVDVGSVPRIVPPPPPSKATPGMGLGAVGVIEEMGFRAEGAGFGLKLGG